MVNQLKDYIDGDGLVGLEQGVHDRPTSQNGFMYTGLALALNQNEKHHFFKACTYNPELVENIRKAHKKFNYRRNSVTNDKVSFDDLYVLLNFYAQVREDFLRNYFWHPAKESWAMRWWFIRNPIFVLLVINQYKHSFIRDLSIATTGMFEQGATPFLVSFLISELYPTREWAKRQLRKRALKRWPCNNFLIDGLPGAFAEYFPAGHPLIDLAEEFERRRNGKQRTRIKHVYSKFTLCVRMCYRWTFAYWRSSTKYMGRYEMKNIRTILAFLLSFLTLTVHADSLSGKYLYNIRLHFEANDSGTQQAYTDPALVAKWVPEAVAFQKLVESMGLFADYQMTYDSIVGIAKGPKVEGTTLNWIQWVASRKLSNGTPAAYLNPRAHGGQITFNATDSYKALYDTLKEVGLETSKNFEASALGSFEATDADLASGIVPVYNTTLTGKIYKTTSYLWKVLQGPGTHLATAPRTGGMRKMKNGQIVIHDGDGDLGTTLEGLQAVKNKQLPCVIAFLMVKPWYLKSSTNSFYTSTGVKATDYLPALVTQIKTFKGARNLSLSAMARLYPGTDYVYDAKTYLVK